MKTVTLTIIFHLLFNCSEVVAYPSLFSHFSSYFSKAADVYSGFRSVLCMFGSECCYESWKHVNITNLETRLNEHVYGQHIMQHEVPHLLQDFIMEPNPKKPLVLSFHGGTGTGKNYVSRFIAETLFREGMRSEFVHQLISTLHFPNAKDVDLYKANIQSLLNGNVSKCGYQLFIFDEMDKMHPGIIDAIKPFIDYYELVNNINFRHCIFIFLSNAAGHGITKQVYQVWMEAQKREEITYDDLHRIIPEESFNEQGGLYRSNIISKHLVDAYIPFLPLEKSHVMQCISDEMRHFGHFSFDLELIEKVANKMTFWPDDTKVYSVSGCKGITQAVGRELWAQKKFEEEKVDKLVEFGELEKAEL